MHLKFKTDFCWKNRNNKELCSISILGFEFYLEQIIGLRVPRIMSCIFQYVNTWFRNKNNRFRRCISRLQKAPLNLEHFPYWRRQKEILLPWWWGTITIKTKIQKNNGQNIEVFWSPWNRNTNWRRNLSMLLLS